MARDWEDFKREYVEGEKKRIMFRLELLEQKFESPIERVMYVVLRDEFEWAITQDRAELIPQKQIGKYRVDFYFSYTSDQGELVEFVIECDGHDYHERTKEQAQHDKKRDRFFTEKGYIVLRYTGSEILREPHKLTEPIYTIMVKKDGVI